MKDEQKKILIIDDELSFVDFLTAFLDREGYSTVIADDGLVGLKVARAEMPDLIILAVMLPEVDGLHVCRLLKYDSDYQHIPILMVTDEGTELDSELMESIDADGMISKPVNPEDMLTKISKIVMN